MAHAANATGSARPGAATRSARSIWLAAVIYWCFSGLLAALGFSLGLYLVRTCAPAAPDNGDWLQASSWPGWYKQIASDGYEYDPDRMTNIAFFPVYPLLARAVMIAIGLRAEAALLIVSNASLLAALGILALYIRDRYPSGPVELIDYAMLAAVFFPTGCFFRLPYSESIFLLVALLVMYAMLHHWSLWAIALLAGLATATRPVGVALLLPFAIHIWRRTYAEHQPEAPTRSIRNAARGTGDPRPAEAEDCNPPTCPRREPTSAAPRCVRPLGSHFGSACIRLAVHLPLACWGLAAFVAYQYHAFDEPLAFVKVQKDFGTPATWREKVVSLETLAPLRSVYDRRSSAFWTNRDRHGIAWFSLQFANPIFFLAAIALVAFGSWHRSRSIAPTPPGEQGLRPTVPAPPPLWLSVEEISLSALLLLIPYVTRAQEMGMGSMGRFVAVVFPIYLVLGQFLVRLPGALRAALFTISGFFLAAYTALYAARYMIN